jgi:hypothetical protein
LTTIEIKADIEGRRLYGLLAGEGEPVVILDAGLGDTSEIWSKIQPEVARISSVFSYDRAGLGHSDMAPIPRTCKEIVGDLRNLLSAANIRPPYVIVAHSWSGLNARWYAAHYPGDIAGMVLIDPVHEDKYEQFEKVLSAEQASRMWVSVKDPSKNDENIDRMTSIEQVRSLKRSFDFPLIVLTRETDADDLNKIETNLQRGFLKLSSKSKQFISKHTDHYIQNSEPELVIDAIRQIVESIR